MNTILVYLLLFCFWGEKALGFELSSIKGLSFMNLSIYLLLFAWAVKVAIKRKFYDSSNLNKYLLLFIFVGMVSIIVKIWNGEIQNISILGELVSLKNWANPFILFFVVFNVIEDENSCNNVLFGLVALLFMSVVTMFLVIFGVADIGILKLSHEGRASGFGNANAYASYLVLFLPLLLSYCLFHKVFLIKYASVLLFTMTLAGLFLTGSRGGFFSLLFGMAGYLLILYREKILRLHSIAAVLALLGLLLVISFSVAPSNIKGLVSERFDPGKSADLKEYTSGRTTLWANGLKMFMERPILGHGQDTYISLAQKRFKYYGAAHNQFITYMVEYGIIGLAIFFMILAKVWQHVWHQFTHTADLWKKILYASYIGGFLGWVLSMFAVELFLPSHIFWIYTAVIYKYAQLDEI